MKQTRYAIIKDDDLPIKPITKFYDSFSKAYDEAKFLCSHNNQNYIILATVFTISSTTTPPSVEKHEEIY